MFDNLTAIFAQDGPLASHINNYFPRDAQLIMALKVAEVIQKQGILLCEAGTGTGKTFAYLIPAILSGQPAIISTGTRNLQDQLYYKDLPLIASALESQLQRSLKVALLKGRGNYLCLYRFQQACTEGWYDDSVQIDLQEIERSLKYTRFADKAEFVRVKEQSRVWSVVTSNSDNCLGIACPKHDDCYVLSAREQAIDADIIIVNHHLLMADLKLKSDVLGELLPAVSTYIIDEAHQLPDIASRFFSQKIASRQIRDLLRDIHRALAHVRDERFNELSKTIRDGLDELAVVLGRYRQRGAWAEVSRSIKPLTDELLSVLKNLYRLLQGRAAETVELDNCARRCQQLYQVFVELTTVISADLVHWFECSSREFEINLTPLAVGEVFQQQLCNSDSGWIFTSATLAVNPLVSDKTVTLEAGESFDSLPEQQDKQAYFHYYASQLGLAEYDSLQLSSPFNYSRQAVLFAPRNLPAPTDRNYNQHLVRQVIPVLERLGGKTFFLFTSYRAMLETRDLLSGMDFHLLVQGDAPKQQLVDEFKSSDRAILLGTSSFWEGVDVKGAALSCVIIDKLPFASPADPVMQARINFLQQQGVNAFYQYQLPQAAMSLKQGVGRLIRDISDTGILIIADPRFYFKSYGHYLRQCLPEIPIESDIEQLFRVFEEFRPPGTY